jgi:N-acetylneuraminic acid mutarotase
MDSRNAGRRRLPLLVTFFLAVCGSAFAQTAAPPLEIKWRLGPDFPEYRKAGFAGVVEGKVVFAGGVGPLKPYSAVVQFDPRTERYSRLPDTPKALNWSFGVAVADSLYVVGAAGPRRGFATNECYRLFREKPDQPFQWIDEPSLPISFQYHNIVAALEDLKFIVSGPGEGAKNAVLGRWVDAPEKPWFRLPNHPGAERFAVPVAGARGRFYFFGGLDANVFRATPKRPADDRPLKDAYRLDPIKKEWAPLADLPMPLYNGIAVTYLDRYIIIVGGYAKGVGATEALDNGRRVQGYNDRITVYDVETDRYWVLEDRLPFGVNDPGVCIIDDTIYALCGENKDKATQTSSNYLQLGTIRRKPAS